MHTTTEPAPSGSDAPLPRRWRWPGRRWRSWNPVTVCVVVATAVFALAGIGSPLLGLTVLADTGSLSSYSGYRDVLAGVGPQTVDLRDQVDAAMPNEILFGEALRDGEFAAWNPYSLGGGTLGSTPNLAIASPLTVPYWFLPGWLAPAYVRLLELICAIGGTYLFLRRLRLRPAAATLGGLAFASSGFMVAWSGWPQTRVAALIPVLFWAVDRLAERVRVREVALVALVVAGMLLGGFPAVTGYALLTAAAYLLVRTLAEPDRHWRPVASRLAAAGAAVAAGAGLAAWQLVPWARHIATVLVLGRSQDPGSHIPPEALLTAIAPYAFGTVSPAHPPDWFGPLRLIDADAYIGAAALVLVLAAVALPRTARALLPRGVWWFLVAGAATWTVAIFLGGPLLWLLQQLPYLFSDNFVGRARSVLGLLFAALAAVGFDAVLRARPSAAKDPTGRTGRRYGIAVWVVAAAGGVALYLAARSATRRAYVDREPGEPDYLSFLHGQLAVGLVLLALAGAAVAWLWFADPDGDGRRARLRAVAAAGLVLLVAGQALWWVRSYHPRTDRADFYPPNPSQAYLAQHLGHERYYGADGAIFGSVDVTARLRGYHGHGFIDRTYADLADTLPGQQFVVPPTAIVSDAYGGAAATSPALDRAAVTHYVAPPEVRPFGPVHLQPGDGTRAILRPGQPVTVPLPTTGPIRGVGVTPLGPPDGPAARFRMRVTLTDTDGEMVAEGERVATDEDLLGVPWVVALAAEDVAPDRRLVARILIEGDPLTTVGLAGRPAVTTVASAEDGLRLEYARESVIYRRMTALTRARWASSAVVEPDPESRVQLVASGDLRPDQVVLDAPGPAADGLPARVTWISDGLDEMVLSVRANGAGYLVLADAMQTGWRATVDGSPADLVHADHAFVAVAVGPGTHTVRFSYPWPWTGAGAWITVATVLLLLGGLGTETWLTRTGRTRTGLIRTGRTRTGLTRWWRADAG
jgi:hypothetical protein